MPANSYQDLTVWQKAMHLAELAYRLTESFPKHEQFGMTSQIRRSAVSIPANIAEGWGREGGKEFLYFLRIAQGSLKELETLLMLSSRLSMAAQESFPPVLALLSEVSRMLRALMTSVHKRSQ